MTVPTRHDETPDVAELRRLAEARPMPGSDWYEFKGLTRRYILSADAAFIAAASPGVVLGLLDRLAHTTEARDNARAEVERLTGKVEAVRALHEPTFWYTDECDDPECDRECVELWGGELFHADAFERVCETCSGGDLSMIDDEPALWPCPTIRALDGGES